MLPIEGHIQESVNPAKLQKVPSLFNGKGHGSLRKLWVVGQGFVQTRPAMER
jgi:hypothetical protein